MSSVKVRSGVFGSPPPSSPNGAKFRGSVIDMSGLRCADEERRVGDGSRSAMITVVELSAAHTRCWTRDSGVFVTEGAETRSMQGQSVLKYSRVHAVHACGAGYAVMRSTRWMALRPGRMASATAFAGSIVARAGEKKCIKSCEMRATVAGGWLWIATEKTCRTRRSTTERKFAARRKVHVEPGK